MQPWPHLPPFPMYHFIFYFYTYLTYWNFIPPSSSSEIGYWTNFSAKETKYPLLVWLIMLVIRKEGKEKCLLYLCSFFFLPLSFLLGLDWCLFKLPLVSWKVFSFFIPKTQGSNKHNSGAVIWQHVCRNAQGWPEKIVFLCKIIYHERVLTSNTVHILLYCTWGLKFVSHFWGFVTQPGVGEHFCTTFWHRFPKTSGKVLACSVITTKVT